MRKIFIAIAASLLIAVGSTVRIEQVNSKFIQSAMAQQANASPLVLAELEEREPSEGLEEGEDDVSNEDDSAQEEDEPAEEEDEPSDEEDDPSEEEGF